MIDTVLQSNRASKLGHAQSAVAANDFAVDHLVLYNVLHESTKLVGPAKALREGNGSSKCILDERCVLRGERERVRTSKSASALCIRSGLTHLGLLRQALQQGRQEDTWGDSVDSDAVLAKLARQWQHHADNSALAGRVCSLSDLAIKGSNAARGRKEGRHTRVCEASCWVAVSCSLEAVPPSR